MKTVCSTQEGVNINAKLNFGSTKEIVNEFQYLMTTYETDFEAEFNYYFRITDDNYIQLANSFEKDDLKIIAQYKKKTINFKENVIFIVKAYVEAYCLYDGFPKLKNSIVFSQKEFGDLINDIKIEKTKKAIEKETPLISFLRDNELYPIPSGNNSNSWIAKCPSGGNHFIQIVTTNDEWGCGYCNRNGRINELKQWLREISVKNDQKNLSKMMQELKNGGIQTKEILNWWLNRY